MIGNYNELRNERDSLDGNLNRMCVTDEEKELESMHQWALKRIQTIYEYNKMRLHLAGKQCIKCDDWRIDDRIQRLFGDTQGYCKTDHFIKDGNCTTCALFKKEVN